MTTTYIKSLLNDLHNSWNQYQLHTEIVKNNGITETLIGITANGDEIEIVFASALSSGEQTVLNMIITNHVPVNDKGTKILSYTLNGQVVTSSYKKILGFKYLGSVQYNITNVEIIGSLTSGSSYDVRIRDISNNKNVASITLTNTATNSYDMGSISNLPTTSAIFELQARATGLSTAQLDSLFIYYE